MVVLGTEPPVCVNVRDEAKPAPVVVETWKPAGAFIFMLLVRLEPLTLYACSAEGMPDRLVNDGKEKG
jgi:hypothetical protein